MTSMADYEFRFGTLEVICHLAEPLAVQLLVGL
jgi:hypothetical protein